MRPFLFRCGLYFFECIAPDFKAARRMFIEYLESQESLDVFGLALVSVVHDDGTEYLFSTDRLLTDVLMLRLRRIKNMRDQGETVP